MKTLILTVCCGLMLMACSSADKPLESKELLYKIQEARKIAIESPNQENVKVLEQLQREWIERFTEPYDVNQLNIKPVDLSSLKGIKLGK